MNTEYWDLNDLWGYLRFQARNDNIKVETVADTIDYLRDKCKHCYNNEHLCSECKLHNLMKNHVKARMFPRWVYKNLKEYGNCYFNQSKLLTKEQLFDLKVFGFDCESEIGKNTKELIIKVRSK